MANAIDTAHRLRVSSVRMKPSASDVDCQKVMDLVRAYEAKMMCDAEIDLADNTRLVFFYADLEAHEYDDLDLLMEPAVSCALN